MIIVNSIPWQPIEDMPEDRKDGRQVLLWNEGPNIGSWHKGPRWYDNGPGWIDDGEGGPIDDVTAWADINTPDY